MMVTSYRSLTFYITKNLNRQKTFETVKPNYILLYKKSFHESKKITNYRTHVQLFIRESKCYPLKLLATPPIKRNRH